MAFHLLEKNVDMKLKITLSFMILHSVINSLKKSSFTRYLLKIFLPSNGDRSNKI